MCYLLSFFLRSYKTTPEEDDDDTMCCPPICSKKINQCHCHLLRNIKKKQHSCSSSFFQHSLKTTPKEDDNNMCVVVVPFVTKKNQWVIAWCLSSFFPRSCKTIAEDDDDGTMCCRHLVRSKMKGQKYDDTTPSMSSSLQQKTKREDDDTIATISM